MQRIATFFFLSLGLANLYAAGDTLPAKQTRLRLDYWNLTASSLFDENRSALDLENDFELSRNQFEIQYGLYEGVTLIMNAEYKNQNWDDGSASYESKGFGSTYLALKQKIPATIFGQVFYSEVGVVLPQAYDETDPLPLGSGGIDWVLLGTYAQNFGPNQSGVELDIGYIFRNGRPDDEFLIRAHFHIGTTRNSQINLHYESHESKSNSQTAYDPLVYPIDQGAQKGGLDFKVGLSPKWNLFFQAESMFRGRNSFKTQGYGIGLQWIR
ncbi:MAG: hypothetical protein H6510_09905 [Acidobacteria bacterium]|nr:hypothetical protein [Acidobacteriota bacterium]MCB9398121.1 hypothetical protein [Acidobacteriota bacterium]